MAAGASRETQYDDFYKIHIAKADDSVTCEKINVVELDGFGGRHSIGCATWNGKSILFGGQDVMEGKVFNDLHSFDHTKNEMEKVEYLEEGLIRPKPRNSHTFV